MPHCTYIVCKTCRTGHQLVDEDRFTYMIGRTTLTDFCRRHVHRGHDVACLDSETARQVIGEPELFTQGEPGCDTHRHTA